MPYQNCTVDIHKKKKKSKHITKDNQQITRQKKREAKNT